MQWKPPAAGRGLIHNPCSETTVTIHHEVEVDNFTCGAFFGGINASSCTGTIGAEHLLHSFIGFTVFAFEYGFLDAENGCFDHVRIPPVFVLLGF